MQQTKFTERAEGVMSLHWVHDTDLARIYFDDFLSEYERVDRSETYKRAGYSCKDLTVISINGYSQADVAWIKVPHAEATKGAIDHLTRIFYDSPIYASIEIEGGEDYRLDEFYDDVYDSSREALIAAIGKSDMDDELKARALALVPKQEYAAYD